MKLHLPKMLTAAIIAAFAVTGAYATTTTTTTYADGTVFNGDIWTWNNAGDGKDVSAAASKYTKYGTEEQYAGNANMTSVGGPDAFWKAIQFNSETAYVGNTLRFAGATSSIRLNTDYQAWVWIGGIITEEGNSGTYTLGRDSSDIRLKGNHDVNMIIKSDFTLKSGSARSTEIMTGGTWDVAAGKTLTFTGKSLTHYTGQTVKITGAGTVTFDTPYTGQAGALFNVGEGATLSFANTAQLGGTITNAGTVTFGSTVSIADSLTGFEVSAKYVDYNDEEATDGYAGAMTYTLVKGGTFSTLPSQVTWKDQTLDVTDGTVTIGDSVDKTMYYLVTNGASLDLADELSHNNQLTKVSMATGTTLNVNTDFIDNTVNGAGTATVNISANKTLSGTIAGVALTGSGTYALAPNASALGTGVTFAPTWTGTVKLSGISSLANIDLNQYGQAGSKVEMNGVTGHFLKDPAAFTPQLVLGENGLTLNDGFSTDSQGVDTVYTFGGGVSGTGNMTFQHKGGTGKEVRQILDFTGNVADWTGSLNLVQGFKVTAKFSGTTTTVNAGIASQQNGRLHVVVGTGSDTSDVTFAKAITNASSLTVQQGASATLKDASSIGTLTSTGSLTVNASGKTVSIGGGTIAKTITLKAGTLSLAGTYNLDGLTCEDYHFEYIGGKDISDGNGFRKASGTVQVADMQGGTLSVATDATFSYKEDAVAVDTTTGVGSITSDVDYTTFYANTGSDSFKAAWAVAQGQPEPQEITTVVVADKASIFMDMPDASIALKMTGDATVEADWHATITSVEGWSGNTLTISGSETITTPQSVVLDEEGDALVVDERATLAITGNNSNLTLQHGTATVHGIVNINHELDLSKNKTSDAKLVIATDGEVTANGMWMHQGGSIELDYNGRFAIGNLIFRGQGDTSTITYNDDPTKDSRYTEANNKYVITDTTIIASGDATIGLALNNCDVETGFNTVTLNSNAAAVTINVGGVFHQGDGVEVDEITVEDGGTVGNGVDVSQAEIVRGATAMYVNNLADSDVTFYQGTDLVTVTNETGTQAAYTGIGQANMKVTADKLGAVAGQDVTVANKVVVNSILNLGEALTLTHVDTDVLNSIDNYGGQVTLLNVSGGSFELSELSLFTTTVAAYTDSTSTTEATVTITDALIAGGGTLLANLTLVGNSTLDVNGGDDYALTLGSLLTVDNSDDLVNLDDATLAAISRLNEGDRVTLVKGLNGTSFSTNLTHGEEAGLYFNLGSINGSDYMVFVTDSAMGIEKTSSVPEPTTGTLSLLALMALAARRRRK